MTQFGSNAHLGHAAQGLRGVGPNWHRSFERTYRQQCTSGSEGDAAPAAVRAWSSNATPAPADVRQIPGLEGQPMPLMQNGIESRLPMAIFPVGAPNANAIYTVD